MFVLAEERVVEWPVKVHVVKDGRSVQQAFTATWRIPDIDAVDEGIGDGRDPRRLRDFLSEHLVGWSGIEDAAGKAVAYGDDAKAALLRWSDAVEALAISFSEAVRGGRRKN